MGVRNAVSILNLKFSNNNFVIKESVDKITDTKEYAIFCCKLWP